MKRMRSIGLWNGSGDHLVIHVDRKGSHATAAGPIGPLTHGTETQRGGVGPSQTTRYTQSLTQTLHGRLWRGRWRRTAAATTAGPDTSTKRRR